MANEINIGALADRLKENVLEYQTIFGLKLTGGEGFRNDFTVLPITQKIILVRDELGNVTQPGRKGTENFTTGAIVMKNRTGELRPGKVDLQLGELELYKLKTSFLGSLEPGSDTDITAFAGRNYIMNRLFTRVMKEISNATWRGVAADTGLQGGLNLFDGLGAKFAAGYATSGTGAIGDIPAGNKVASPAATVTSANILGELKKIADLILANEVLTEEFMSTPCSLFMPYSHYGFMVTALEAALTNGSQIVSRGADGNYYFNLIPTLVVKPRLWLTGVDNMFATPDNNLFYLTGDTSNSEPTIDIQKVNRSVNIFIDFEANVDYADGRVVVLHK